MKHAFILENMLAVSTRRKDVDIIREILNEENQLLNVFTVFCKAREEH